MQPASSSGAPAEKASLVSFAATMDPEGFSHMALYGSGDDAEDEDEDEKGDVEDGDEDDKDDVEDEPDTNSLSRRSARLGEQTRKSFRESSDSEAPENQSCV